MASEFELFFSRTNRKDAPFPLGPYAIRPDLTFEDLNTAMSKPDTQFFLF